MNFYTNLFMEYNYHFYIYILILYYIGCWKLDAKLDGVLYFINVILFIQVKKENISEMHNTERKVIYLIKIIFINKFLLKIVSYWIV